MHFIIQLVTTVCPPTPHVLPSICDRQQLIRQKRLWGVSCCHLWSDHKQNISWFCLPPVSLGTLIYLTSFIFAALNDGVRMLRTLFQRSFLNMSRQSLMGLVMNLRVCTERQESTGTSICHHYITVAYARIVSKHIVRMCMSSPFCLGSCWTPWPSLVWGCRGPPPPPPVCGTNNT